MRLRTSRILAGIAIVAAALVLFTFACGTYVPEFRGVVLDARTGSPIAGATVIREFIGPPPIDFVDTRSAKPIRSSWLEVTTDAQGRFVLPRYSAFFISAMGWLVYAPGFMPATGCYDQENWIDYGCPTPPQFSYLDAWTKTTMTKSTKGVTFEVRLFPPTTEGIEWPLGKEWVEYNPDTKKHDLVRRFPEDVDPWGEYFRRLNILTQERWLPEETVIEEAVKFVDGGGRVTRNILSEIAEAGSRFGGFREETYCYKAELAWRAFGLEERVCQQQPDLHCEPRSLAVRRSYLQEECPSFRR